MIKPHSMFCATWRSIGRMKAQTGSKIVALHPEFVPCHTVFYSSA
jgi:hypothetical protein